jgi:uncharacterized protein YeaO (DUF488 family)
MPVYTKRWNDPVGPDDGFRLLICRHRPRGVPRVGEPWDASCLALAPSAKLVAAFYGKSGPAISFEDYAERFHQEMQGASFWIKSFAERVHAGETLTLLCSSACDDEARCHRTLVKALIDGAVRQLAAPAVERRASKPAHGGRHGRASTPR